MTKPLADRAPHWHRVLGGEEPQYCESFSGSDWKDAQLDAYFRALGECAAALVEARAEVKLARERLGPAGWKMLMELKQLRAALERGEK